MDKRISYGVIIGLVLIAIGLALREFAHQEGLQIVLFFPTILVVGIVMGRVKRGLIWGFGLSAVYALVSSLLFASGGSFGEVASNPNVLLAVLVLTALIPGVVGGTLGALGGLIGRRFKR